MKFIKIQKAMNSYIKRISIASLIALVLVGGSILTYADIDVNQPIDALVAYVRGLIFTDNGLPDGNIKAILKSDSNLSVDIKLDTKVNKQVLIGQFCKDNYDSKENIYKLCIGGGWKAANIAFDGAWIKSSNGLKIDIGPSFYLKSDEGYLFIVDKTSNSVIIDTNGLATFNGGVWVGGPIQLGGLENVGCNANTYGTIKLIGGQWKVCESGSWKTIQLWDGNGLPTQLPTSSSNTSPVPNNPLPGGGSNGSISPQPTPTPNNGSLPPNGGSSSDGSFPGSLPGGGGRYYIPGLPVYY